MTDGKKRKKRFGGETPTDATAVCRAFGHGRACIGRRTWKGRAKHRTAKRMIGIIIERHYSRNVILKGKTSPKTFVRDIMERNVINVRAEQSVELCMTLMTDKVRHLPLLEGTKLIGIIIDAGAAYSIARTEEIALKHCVAAATRSYT
jgi:CBS domain-containing protein